MDEQGSREASGELRAGLAIVVAMVAGVFALRLMIWKPFELARHGFFRDDTLFYAMLSRNFSELGFLTFDGSMPTSGVQPLWMGILIAADRFFGGTDPLLTTAHLSWGCFVAFAFAGTWLVARGTTREAITRAAVFAAIVPLNFWFQSWTLQGIETPLLLLSFALLAIALDDADRRTSGGPGGTPPSLGRILLLALLCTACFFARTDQFWVWGVVLAWLVVRRGLRFGGIVAFGALSATLIVPYLVNNWITHGSPVPISGRVKRFYMESALPTFGSWLGSEEWHGPFTAFAEAVPFGGEIPAFVTIPLAAALLAWFFVRVWRGLRRGEGAAGLPTSLILLGAAAALHLGFMLVFYRELRPRTSYYFAGTVLVVAWSLAWGAPRIVERAQARGRRVGAAVLGVWVLASAVAAWQAPEPSRFWSAGIDMAAAIDSLPPAASVGAIYPGALAYFSSRPVTSLDGIVGSQRYLEESVRTGNQIEALLARPNPYLAIYLDAPPERFFAAGPPPTRRWSRFFEPLFYEYRNCPMQVIARRPDDDAGKHWYLVRLDFGAGDACRQRSS